MRNLNFLLLGLSVLIFSNCSVKDKNEEQPDLDVVEMGNGKEWKSANLSIFQILVSDSLIWICSEQTDNEIVYAYTKDGKLKSSGISQGSGPDEILEVSSFHLVDDGGVAIYDGRTGKIHQIDSDGDTMNSKQVLDSMFPFDDVAFISDNRIIELPMNSSTSYILSDINGNILDSLSYFPPKPKHIDDNTHQLACTGSLAFSPDGKYLVRAIAFGGSLDFFNISNDKISHIKRYSIFDMEYDALDGMVQLPVPNDKTRMGFSSLYATSKYLYASFSDEKATDNPDGESNEIYIFDFEGNPLKKMIFSQRIGTFGVSPDDRMLYAVHDKEDKTEILQYEISECLQNIVN